LEAKADVNQEKVEAILEVMEANREEVKACQETMEAIQENI
jgi:hypothetical protein